MSNYIPMNPQIVDDAEFQNKPTWAKAIWLHLWCKCDFAGFADANWRVVQVISNVEEPKTDEEIWEALDGLVVAVEGKNLAYVKNYIQTARAQGGEVRSTAGVHLKIYKDMKMRKQRFKVKDPMSYARKYNPDLNFAPLPEGQKSDPKEGETGKETPRHLFDVLGIPDEGYVAWNKREEGASKSVPASQNNKSSEVTSYTQQDDGVEDFFSPVEQEQRTTDNKPLNTEELDPLGLAAPNQSKPINTSVDQEVHDGYIDEGQVMLKDGGYAANGWESLRKRVKTQEEGTDEGGNVIANF
jgi:hypothetical protein